MWFEVTEEKRFGRDRKEISDCKSKDRKDHKSVVQIGLSFLVHEITEWVHTGRNLVLEVLVYLTLPGSFPVSFTEFIRLSQSLTCRFTCVYERVCIGPHRPGLPLVHC